MLNIKGYKLTYKNIKIPGTGEKIILNDGILTVPNNPIIPFIEGDGIGSDITPAMIDVVNASVEKAYGDEKSISWMEIYLSLIHISEPTRPY